MVSETPPKPLGDCILFATADWDDPYWTNKQHTAKALVALGWRVLYVESIGLRKPNAASGKDWKRLWARLIKGLRCLIAGSPERAPNLHVLSPLSIPGAHTQPWLAKLNQFLLKIGIHRHVNRHESTNPLIWTYHPYMLAAINRLKKTRLLYHCVDDLSAVPGIDSQSFKSAEIELLQSCHIVFATTQHLADACARYNSNTHFLANVVDADHFGKAFDAGPIPSDLKGIPYPRLVYHGVLSDFKVDFELLLDAAKKRTDWQWILIGDEREGQKSTLLAALKALPNVHFLGYKPYAELPDYLRGMNVGLLPTKINEYTQSMFPMKYFEYIASGLPVVSTQLEFTKTHKAGVEVCKDSATFIHAIKKKTSERKLTKVEALNIIEGNTWEIRTEKMITTLFKQ